MILATAMGGFPKSARLRKSRDFRFYPFRRFQTEHFTFVYTTAGQGRLGISISKKVLRRATARNRVRRLLREVFRFKINELTHLDVHVIGAPPLKEAWSGLKLQDVEAQFGKLIQRLA